MGQVGKQKTFRIPVASLVPGDSPRLSGEVAEHVQLLAQCESPLPPILVHRERMQVIDGMHRLHAAIRRGDETIEVEFFEGDNAAAFLTAVKLNVKHGLPLSRADREAAAARIISSHPHHSDRAIASITGLAQRTVASIRARTEGETGVTARIGRDGRVRPLNSAGARRVASEVLAKHPDASLRQVAHLAGLSPATVRDVRERMRRGDDPVPERERQEAETEARSARQTGMRRGTEIANDVRDRKTLLDNLSRDPALRFSESGRKALRWLFLHTRDLDTWEEVVSVVPPHCAYSIVELAQACASEWLSIAERLERGLRNTA